MMRFVHYMAFVLCTLVVARSAVAGDAKAAVEAQATLPLSEILRLYREQEQRSQVREETPPVTASISRIDVRGRLSEHSVDLQADFEVVVLGSEWISLSLLEVDPATAITELPTLADVLFTV